MNDEELVDAWTTLEPTLQRRQRMDVRVSAWLDARDTPLATEWLGIFGRAPLTTAGLAAVGAVSVITATPFVWLASVLI